VEQVAPRGREPAAAVTVGMGGVYCEVVWAQTMAAPARIINEVFMMAVGSEVDLVDVRLMFWAITSNERCRSCCLVMRLNEDINHRRRGG
jgi:hypothetical protein